MAPLLIGGKLICGKRLPEIRHREYRLAVVNAFAEGSKIYAVVRFRQMEPGHHLIGVTGTYALDPYDTCVVPALVFKADLPPEPATCRYLFLCLHHHHLGWIGFPYFKVRNLQYLTLLPRLHAEII